MAGWMAAFPLKKSGIDPNMIVGPGAVGNGPDAARNGPGAVGNGPPEAGNTRTPPTGLPTWMPPPDGIWAMTGTGTRPEVAEGWRRICTPGGGCGPDPIVCVTPTTWEPPVWDDDGGGGG